MNNRELKLSFSEPRTVGQKAIGIKMLDLNKPAVDPWVTATKDAGNH
jgi:hypothetical protein